MLHAFCSLSWFFLASVIDQQTFDRLMPAACEWAKAQEEFILARGTPLAPRYVADAQRVGVQHHARVRVLVVDRMPLPEDKELAEAARQTHIITNACRGVTIGYGIVIRADAWGDRELMLHQLVHVAQCERNGGLQSFVELYLSDRQRSEKFTLGALEEEARRLAHEICFSAGSS
ncbi:MAG TPA: hypothetical protein VGM62_15710 [Chthoniobacterales bacterium]|jgi:hypothetical protein